MSPGATPGRARGERPVSSWRRPTGRRTWGSVLSVKDSISLLVVRRRHEFSGPKVRRTVGCAASK